MKRMFFACVLVALFGTAAFAAKQDVTITAPDGFALKGSLYSTGKTGPGILLIHQCDADRRIYDNLANLMSAEGYTVVTYDSRGVGDSKAGEFTDPATQRDKIRALGPGDVDAVFQFLSSQKTVTANRMAVLGASCGVGQAVAATRRHADVVRALVLLSGGTDADGQTFIKTSTNLPIFGAASEEDTRAATSIKQIMGITTNGNSKLTIFKDAGHAGFMFAKEKDLEPSIVRWLKTAIPTEGFSSQVR